MLIKRIGPDGTERTRDLNITAEQYADWEANKAPSKEIFTNLSEEDIIFIDVGLTKSEIDRLSTEQLNRRSKYLSSDEL